VRHRPPTAQMTGGFSSALQPETGACAKLRDPEDLQANDAADENTLLHHNAFSKPITDRSVYFSRLNDSWMSIHSARVPLACKS
jgi:hypothetical protein